ncbi:MAG TPA: hypothetical protein VK254_03910 [Candidatus Bathyarchaeia archaeon]|nr:hypothetical protein [Candidatus Bathyarchaeia archaeon]
METQQWCRIVQTTPTGTGIAVKVERAIMTTMITMTTTIITAITMANITKVADTTKVEDIIADTKVDTGVEADKH